MHAWEGKPFDDVAAVTVRRDPRRYPIGCATGDGSAEALQWFRSVPELTQYLVRMEPQRWGIRGAQHLELKPQLEEALTAVAVAGLDPGVREAYNRVVAPRYRILWWGTLERLCEGADDWATRLLAQAGAAEAHGDDRLERLLSFVGRRARGNTSAGR